MGNEVCPGCGSKGKLEEGANYWQCGSHDRRGFFYQSDLCESRESLAEKDARIAALTVELERVKGELEDARIYITTEDGAKLHIRNLIRCGLRSLRKKRGAFWSHVADSYGVGSTSAHRLCRFVDLNPDTGELEPT